MRACAFGLSTRVYLCRNEFETGVYADEVLQHYFPPSMAVISNIAAG